MTQKSPKIRSILFKSSNQIFEINHWIGILLIQTVIKRKW